MDTIGSAFTLSLEDKYIIKLTDILSSPLLKPYEGIYIETINPSVTLATVNFRTVGGGYKIYLQQGILTIGSPNICKLESATLN